METEKGVTGNKKIVKIGAPACLGSGCNMGRIVLIC